MEGSDLRYQEGEDAGHLEDKVDGCERPMVLGGEAEVEKEDACEGEDNASKQDLYWQRTRKIWLVFEHWVVW